MTFEERFEIIGNGLIEVIKIQSRNAESLDQITQMFSRHVDSTDARMKRVEESVGGLSQKVGRLTETVNGLGEKMDRYMDLADSCRRKPGHPNPRDHVRAQQRQDQALMVTAPRSETGDPA